MKALKAFGAVAIGLASATAAQAATIVTQWEADITAEWISAAPGAVTLTPKLLSWGTPATNAGKSSLLITDPAQDQTVNTYIGGGLPPPAFTAPGITLTHTNNVIFDPDTWLTDATLRLTANLKAKVPSGAGPGDLPPVTYDLRFKETINTDTLAGCSVASSPTPCNDIFVQLTGLLNDDFTYNTGDGALDYFVNIFPTSGGVLSVLPPNVCADAGATSPCIGFTTPEGQQTSLSFGFTISTRPLQIEVPEPGTLALLGASLFGLGAFRRRRGS